MNFFVDFSCGIVSGLVNCVSGFFLDTVKVRMQLNPELKSIRQTLKYIIKNQGFAQLFTGIYYPLFTLPLTNSVLFAAYEQYKQSKGKRNLSFMDGLQNGAFAGFAVAFFTTPADLIKVMMQSEKQGRFKHSRECMRYIVNKYGFLGLFKGNTTMILRQVPGFAAQFAIYQVLKQYFISQEKPHLTLAQTLIVCPPAAVVGWIFSYPQDVVKTAIQSQQKNIYKERFGDGGFIEAGKDVFRKSGWKGFFVGITPCLLRAFYSDSLGIVAYQKCRQKFWNLRSNH